MQLNLEATFQEVKIVRRSDIRRRIVALVMAGVVNGVAYIANIGDSRVYGFRNGRINQLSSDHTDEVLMKEQGITGRKPHLTQYLGIDPDELCLEPFIKSYRYEEGDRFLICSDGVTDMVDENLITEIVNRSSTPEIAVQRLIKEAKNNGGKDNITAIVCFVS